MGFVTSDASDTPIKPDYGVLKTDYKEQFKLLKQHRAQVLALLSDSHPEGKEATAPRSWWDWVYGWKPAPAVLTTIDGITVDESTAHGASIRKAVDQLEYSKDTVAHLRWALVHIHATSADADVTTPRNVAPTTPPREDQPAPKSAPSSPAAVAAGVGAAGGAVGSAAALALPVDASSKKGKQLLKEQEKLDAQRARVLQLLQAGGAPAASASEGAYEVDPASKQGKVLIQEIHKYEKQKSKLVQLASKSGIELRPEDLDSFGVYTDDGTAVDASSKNVKQLIKQASTTKRTVPGEGSAAGSSPRAAAPAVAAVAPVAPVIAAVRTPQTSFEQHEDMHDAASTGEYESANEGSFGSFVSFGSSPAGSARNTPMPTPAKVAHQHGMTSSGGAPEDTVPLPEPVQGDTPERRPSWFASMFTPPASK